MSMRQLITAVSQGLTGLVASGPGLNPPADVTAVGDLLAEIGLRGDPETALRRFQERVGLPADGVAGPRTVHLLVGYAREARDLRVFA